jgi:hypothetical protein
MLEIDARCFGLARLSVLNTGCRWRIASHARSAFGLAPETMFLPLGIPKDRDDT